MKYDLEDQNTEVIMSPSSRRAWIEINSIYGASNTVQRRSPRGGRGLKYRAAVDDLRHLPVALLAEGVD